MMSHPGIREAVNERCVVSWDTESWAKKDKVQVREKYNMPKIHEMSWSGKTSRTHDLFPLVAQEHMMPSRSLARHNRGLKLFGPLCGLTR